jgi:hypothetical protein
MSIWTSELLGLPIDKLVGIEVVFWDVTAHKTAEADFEQERSLFDASLENLPDFFNFKKLDSQFLRVSHAFKFTEHGEGVLRVEQES